MSQSLPLRYAKPVPRYTSYPTAPHFHAGVDSGTYRQDSSQRFDAPSEIALPMRWQYPKGACIYDGTTLIGTIGASGSSTAGLRFDTARQLLTLDTLPAQLRITRADGGCAG